MIERLLCCDQEYCCTIPLNFYNAPDCQSLATQGDKGRQLICLSETANNRALQVQLCEDSYLAWLRLDDLSHLIPASASYQPVSLSRRAIEERIRDIIDFTKMAMRCPNEYLWGGTIAPNYDCSGLIQAAFAASGIWLPRDSYQQEEFTSKITQEDLQAGDLIFFGETKVDHVALYLGDGDYIHSSGKEKGRNGIAIDSLSGEGDEISQHYSRKIWSFGRVMTNFKKTTLKAF